MSSQQGHAHPTVPGRNPHISRRLRGQSSLVYRERMIGGVTRVKTPCSFRPAAYNTDKRRH